MIFRNYQQFTAFNENIYNDLRKFSDYDYNNDTMGTKLCSQIQIYNIIVSTQHLMKVLNIKQILLLRTRSPTEAAAPEVITGCEAATSTPSAIED